MKTLSPKQQASVTEFLKDHNAKQSAIRAGYTVKSAEVIGCRLLSKVKVSKAIQEATAVTRTGGRRHPL